MVGASAIENWKEGESGSVSLLEKLALSGAGQTSKVADAFSAERAEMHNNNKANFGMLESERVVQAGIRLQALTERDLQARRELK